MLTKEAVNVLPVYISTKLSVQQKTELFNSQTHVESSNKLGLVSICKNNIEKYIKLVM